MNYSEGKINLIDKNGNLASEFWFVKGSKSSDYANFPFKEDISDITRIADNGELPSFEGMYMKMGYLFAFDKSDRLVPYPNTVYVYGQSEYKDKQIDCVETYKTIQSDKDYNGFLDLMVEPVHGVKYLNKYDAEKKYQVEFMWRVKYKGKYYFIDRKDMNVFRVCFNGEGFDSYSFVVPQQGHIWGNNYPLIILRKDGVDHIAMANNVYGHLPMIVYSAKDIKSIEYSQAERSLDKRVGLRNHSIIVTHNDGKITLVGAGPDGYFHLDIDATYADFTYDNGEYIYTLGKQGLVFYRLTKDKFVKCKNFDYLVLNKDMRKYEKTQMPKLSNHCVPFNIRTSYWHRHFIDMDTKQIFCIANASDRVPNVYPFSIEMHNLRYTEHWDAIKFRGKYVYAKLLVETKRYDNDIDSLTEVTTLDDPMAFIKKHKFITVKYMEFNGEEYNVLPDFPKDYMYPEDSNTKFSQYYSTILLTDRSIPYIEKGEVPPMFERIGR